MADKRLVDHDQALDAAVEEYRRIVKAGHWNWSNFEHEPNQKITALKAEFEKKFNTLFKHLVNNSLSFSRS